MLFRKSLSIAAVLLVLGVLTVSVNVSALSAGGIGGRPANPDPNNPRTQSIFIINTDKGETKKDVILVANNSDRKQTIELYAVDGVVTNTGSFTCSQESEAKQRMGAWISIDKSAVTLDPGKSEEVGFTLAMPTTADVGEHNGCIVFQSADDEEQASGNVRIRTRQAIRVVATVPGNLQRNVEVAGFTTGVDNGKQTYALNLKNTGNVSADVDAKVYLTSLFGSVVYENGGGYPVLADQKLDLSFVNEKSPFFGGWYYASAKIAYDERAGTFGTGDTQHLIQKETKRQLVFIAPTIAGTLTSIALLGLIGSGIGWLLLRRRNRLNALKNWDNYTVEQGDSIQSIATQHDVSWKKLAAINSIAAPYVLKEKTIIRVPAKQNLSKKSK
ncbi:MAG: hypothetical protein JWM07_403 [Candidatus Saccharibacteria bacterium]|nr:hypothetical protein [Candidatus Saccharibacteria bacterium]